MKYYLNAILFLFVIAAVYGFAVPSLVSAKDSIMVISGFALAALTPAALFYWIKLVLKPKAAVKAEEK